MRAAPAGQTLLRPVDRGVVYGARQAQPHGRVRGGRILQATCNHGVKQAHGGAGVLKPSGSA